MFQKAFYILLMFTSWHSFGAFMLLVKQLVKLINISSCLQSEQLENLGNLWCLKKIGWLKLKKSAGSK